VECSVVLDFGGEDDFKGTGVGGAFEDVVGIFVDIETKAMGDEATGAEIAVCGQSQERGGR
jgi:hypothetical protein